VYLIGIDPGLARVGMALVHHDGTKQLERLRLLETQKESDARNKWTVSGDDNRRYWELHEGIVEFLAEVPPKEKVLIAIESFAYVPGAGRNLLKTAQAVGVIKGAIYAHGKRPIEFQPSQVKRTVLGSKSGSKAQIESVLKTWYPNLEEELALYPKGKREHLTDALALTECMFEEYSRQREYLRAIEV
jgi:Holliday junction resolvasome RuvABC endonuclease subunit